MLVPGMVPLICSFHCADGTKSVVLTPSLAAQCGYSMESDPWGNTRIYTSLLACYVDNKVIWVNDPGRAVGAPIY